MKNYLTKAIFIATSFVFIVFFTRFFILEPGRVDGQSMEPKLQHNDFFITDKFLPLFFPFKRFDRIQFLSPIDGRHLVIKRVIGLPGETVIFKRNAVFVRQKNGTEITLTEPYLYPNLTIGVRYGRPHEFRVPPDSYFTIGDNRPISTDSREFGAVHRRNIIGKIIAW